MSAKPYFPRTEAAQIPWFGNLKLKIGSTANQAALSITAGEASLVQSICTLFIYMLETYLPAVRSYGEAWTALAALAFPPFSRGVLQEAPSIRLHPNK